MQTSRTCKLAKVSSLLKQPILIDFIIVFVVKCLAGKCVNYFVSLKLLSQVALLATLFIPKYLHISTGCDVIEFIQ